MPTEMSLLFQHMLSSVYLWVPFNVNMTRLPERFIKKKKRLFTSSSKIYEMLYCFEAITNVHRQTFNFYQSLFSPKAWLEQRKLCLHFFWLLKVLGNIDKIFFVLFKNFILSLFMNNWETCLPRYELRCNWFWSLRKLAKMSLLKRGLSL